MYTLPAPEFFRKAHRMPAYQSVMRERVVALAREEQPEHAPGRDFPQGSKERRMVPATKAALQADPVFSQFMSFG